MTTQGRLSFVLLSAVQNVEWSEDRTHFWQQERNQDSLYAVCCPRDPFTAHPFDAEGAKRLNAKLNDKSKQ